MGAKILQKPKIIDIIGSTIRVAHPVVENIKTYLSANISAGGVNMNVFDNNGFIDEDYFIVGRIGSPETEEGQVNGAVIRGQGITIKSTLKFSHGLDNPITKIFERGIKIYGSNYPNSGGTLIESVSNILSSPAGAVQIQWDKKHTEYTLLNTDTAYDYYYVTFTDGDTDSESSEYVSSTGISHTKIESLIKQALDISNARIDDRKLTREMFVNWANDCQDRITQYVYYDNFVRRNTQKDWSFEIVEDDSIKLIEGEDRYNLLELKLKYPNSDKSVFEVQFGNAVILDKWALKDFDIHRGKFAKTYTGSITYATTTSLSVNSTANFSPSGTLNVGGQIITYGSKDDTTFKDIPANGSGSIVDTININTSVLQNAGIGYPSKYIIFNGNIYLDYPPSKEVAGKTLKIKYLKTIPRILSVSDGTTIPFTNVFIPYFVAMIYYRTGLSDMGNQWMKDFDNLVQNNALADYIPTLDEQTYYNFETI